MSCKGVCNKYKVEKIYGKIGRYENGQKRSTVCEIFIKWDGMYCPCCGSMLRTKPKGSQTRHRLMIIQQVKRI